MNLFLSLDTWEKKYRIISTTKYPQLTCHFIYQNIRKGTAHAVDLSKKLVGDDDVFIALGDTICEYDIKEVLDSPFSMLACKKSG